MQKPKASFCVKKNFRSGESFSKRKKPASTPWFHSAEDSPLHVAFAGHVVRPKVRMVKMMEMIKLMGKMMTMIQIIQMVEKGENFHKHLISRQFCLPDKHLFILKVAAQERKPF